MTAPAPPIPRTLPDLRTYLVAVHQDWGLIPEYTEGDLDFEGLTDLLCHALFALRGAGTDVDLAQGYLKVTMSSEDIIEIIDDVPDLQHLLRAITIAAPKGKSGKAWAWHKVRASIDSAGVFGATFAMRHLVPALNTVKTGNWTARVYDGKVTLKKKIG